MQQVQQSNESWPTGQSSVNAIRGTPLDWSFLASRGVLCDINCQHGHYEARHEHSKWYASWVSHLNAMSLDLAFFCKPLALNHM